MNRELWRDEFEKWLEGFPWQWFCTLTFRPGLSMAAARWRLRKWAEALGAALGTTDFSWIAIPEFGRTGMDFHYHVLVAGLRERHAPQRQEWMRRWHQIAGDALIDKFKPSVGGERYVTKNLNPDDMDNVEVHINSRTRLQTTTWSAQ